MSPMTAIGLVAKREVMTRIRSKALIITTIIMIVGIIGGSFAASVLQENGPDAQKVAVADESLRGSVEAAAATTGTDVDVTTSTRSDAEPELRDGELAALVSLNADDGLIVTVQETLAEPLEPVMAVLAQQLALDHAITGLGGDPAAVNQQVLGAQPTLDVLDPAGAEEVDVASSVVGMIAGILIFIAIMSTGQMVAQGVVEEKSSRVVELLLSTIRPWQLIAGKVLGIGAMGLAQVLLIVAAGAGSALGFGLIDGSSIDIGSTVVWILVWFLIGYAIYATMLGALSSLVSRQEDVSSVITPVMILLMIPYMLGVSIAPWEPDNTIIMVMSLVPFFSPLLMPIRIALGAAAGWELALSVVLCVVVIGVLIALAGKIYSRAVMRTGAKVSLKEALRSE